jgi:hypothetical protein
MRREGSVRLVSSWGAIITRREALLRTVLQNRMGVTSCRYEEKWKSRRKVVFKHVIGSAMQPLFAY